MLVEYIVLYESIMCFLVSDLFKCSELIVVKTLPVTEPNILPDWV